MKNNKIIEEQLLDVAYKLNSTLNYQFILDKIIEERTLALLSTKRATIYKLDSKKIFLEPVATLDSPNEAQVMSQKLNVKSSLSGKVIISKKGIIFNNTSQYPYAYHIPGTSHDLDENLMILPLFIDEEVFGTLNLYRRKKLFSKEDLKFAEIFAMYAGVAIQNAQENQRLIREINKHNETKEEKKESEERLSKFINSADNSYHILDTNFKILEINRAALEAIYLANIGITSKKEVVGQNFVKFYPFLKDELPHFLNVTKTDKKYSNTLIVPHPKLGDLFLSFLCFKVGDDIGVITENITKRKKAEEKLKSRNSELEVFYEAAVNRELNMIELKKEINELLEGKGEKPKYKIIR